MMYAFAISDILNFLNNMPLKNYPLGDYYGFTPEELLRRLKLVGEDYDNNSKAGSPYHPHVKARMSKLAGITRVLATITSDGDKSDLTLDGVLQRCTEADINIPRNTLRAYLNTIKVAVENLKQ